MTDDIDVSAQFEPSAYVRIFPFGPVAGEMAARATVATDGTLQIAGLSDGDYWAVLDGQAPVAVRARGGVISRRDAADAAVAPGPAGAREAPAAGREVVTGARTSANARIKSAIPSLTPLLLLAVIAAFALTLAS